MILDKLQSRRIAQSSSLIFDIGQFNVIDAMIAIKPGENAVR